MKTTAAALAAVLAFSAAASAAPRAKARSAPVAVTPLSPADKIPCPSGPACASFRALAAAGDANVLNADWACFNEGAVYVDPGEDDPPAGKVPEDRFTLYSYKKPANSDDMTHGDFFTQLVRYGKTDDTDHIGGTAAKDARGLDALAKLPPVDAKIGFTDVYDDAPGALTTVNIEFHGTPPAPMIGRELRLDKTTGRFTERTVHYKPSRTDSFHGKCLRLK